MDRKVVAFGLLGPMLDKAKPSQRWERWRPTVSLFQHEDLAIQRFELIHGTDEERLATTVEADIIDVSPETEVCRHQIDWDNPWDFEEVYGKLFDFCDAYAFDQEQERYLVHLTTGTHVAQICWFLLTESRHLPARIVQTAPPRRRQGGDPGSYAIIDLDLSRYDSIAARFLTEATKGLDFLKSGIQTRNAAFNDTIEEIERVAVNSTAPILLMGPTGAGKSQLASRIFELKQARRLVRGPFVPVNCATLRGDSAMSTLFGHVKGAFTGAANNRAGLIKSADGGVLFLDEIGELGADEQAMLLRVLEEKAFLPLGADEEATSDFQLIAGTNRDLAAEVRAGRFRGDLLARINLWSYRMPGLRERREDIEPNLAYEAQRFAREHGRKVRFNKEAEQRYLAFARSAEATWSGNFRDLNASFMRMATLAGGRRITVDIVDREIGRLREAWAGDVDAMAGNPDSDRAVIALLGPEAVADLDVFDRLQLASVIAICRECASLSEAGRRLFQVSRTRRGSINDADRIKKYLERFGLDWNALRNARL